MALKHWIAAATLLTTMPAAMATVLTFDEYVNGTQINDQYFNEYGITINGHNKINNLDNMAVVFDTTLDYTQDPDLEGPFSNSQMGMTDPGNVLIIQESASSCSLGVCSSPDDEGTYIAGYFSVNFGAAVTLNSLDFFDIEYNEANPDSLNNAIHLFDADNIELNIGDFYTPSTGGDNTWGRLDFNVDDVYSMEIHLRGSGAIDNLDITFASVPEPATIGLLGLGLFGLLRTQRSRKA